MSDSPLDNPEIRALLQEAESMARVLRDLGAEEAGNFAAALDQIYADLGRTLHRLVPQGDAFDDDETTAVTGHLAEAMAESAVSPARSTLADILPQDEDEPTDPGIPKPAEEAAAPKGATGALLGRKGARQRRAEERHAAVVAQLEKEGTPHGAEARAATPPGQPEGAFGRAALRTTAAVETGPWIDRLADLLELIALPPTLDTPADLAAEASLVQWSTADLDGAWAPFPPAIRAALLGLLAARARHLQDHLTVDVGPRIALERLSSYRERTGLMKVEGLYPERAPQTGTWHADAHHWWETLVEGLREA